MKSTQVTTWRRYTAAEKKAYRARLARRRGGLTADRWIADEIRHFFADNMGRRVPTIRPRGDVL